jgi:hypothetical protein
MLIALSIQNPKSKIESACFLQLDRPLYEVEAARAAHLFQVTLFYGKEAALVGAVFVYPARRCSVRVFFKKWAFEENLAACAAAITVAATQRERGDDFLLAEIRTDEATQLALGLTGAKLCVLDGARAQPLGEPFFEQALALAATLTQLFHKCVASERAGAIVTDAVSQQLMHTALRFTT